MSDNRNGLTSEQQQKKKKNATTTQQVNQPLITSSAPFGVFSSILSNQSSSTANTSRSTTPPTLPQQPLLQGGAFFPFLPISNAFQPITVPTTSIFPLPFPLSVTPPTTNPPPHKKLKSNNGLAVPVQEVDRISPVNAPSTPNTSKRKKASSDQSHSTKGCSCKKTGCLKRYCECFQNNRRCTENCRCIGCKNYEGCEELTQVLSKTLGNPIVATTSSSLESKGSASIATSSNPTPKKQKITTTTTTTISAPITASIDQINPLFSHRKSNDPSNPYDSLIDTEVISGVCKTLIYTAYREEVNFAKQWQEYQKNADSNEQVHQQQEQKTDEATFATPKTPPRKSVSNSAATDSPKTPPSKKSEAIVNQPSPDTLALLCDEDETLELTQEQKNNLKRKEDSDPARAIFSKKGYDHSLQVTLELAILSKFKELLETSI
jgi:hypothetical protein